MLKTKVLILRVSIGYYYGMPLVLTEKIKVGISACNFGAMVRWNFKGWDRVCEIGRDRDHFSWMPVCPEVMSGLGVSRQPMRLVGGNGDDFWAGSARMKNKLGQDVTEKVKEGLALTLEALKKAGTEAFVFMEGSPSCGVYRTTLKDKRMGKPPGAFGALLLNEGYFLIPAEDLSSPVKWWDWRRRLHAFVWLKRHEATNKKELYDLWHHFKFICQEADIKESEAIGRELASMPGRFSASFSLEWKKKVMLLLRKPSTFKRIYSIMLKHVANYRKHFKEATPIDSLNPLMNKHAFADYLREMEKRSITEGYDFGGTPVVFRDTARS